MSPLTKEAEETLIASPFGPSAASTPLRQLS